MFGAVKLVKNADIDECKCSGHGIGFDRHGTFSVGNGFGKNVIIFRVDMSSSVHVNSWWRSYTRIKWYNTDCIKNYPG